MSFKNFFFSKKKFPLLLKLTLGRYFLINLEFLKKEKRLSFQRNFEEIYQLFKHKLNKRKIVVDVGAMDGTMYDYFNLFINNAEYHLIEASPISFKILQKKNFGDGYVTLHNKLISSDQETYKFYHYNNRKLSSIAEIAETSLNHLVKNNTAPEKIFEIKGEKLSNLFNDIDILKINTQGSEINVLEGSVDLLKKQKIKLIMLEFDYRDIYINEKSSHIKNFESLLSKYNYFIVDIIMMKKINGVLSHGYIVFASHKLK